MSRKNYIPDKRFNPIVLAKKIEESEQKIKKLQVSFDHKYQALENFLTLMVNFASHDIKNAVHNLDGMISTLEIGQVNQQDITDLKMCIDHIRDILAKFGDFSIKRDSKEGFILQSLYQSLEILHRPYLKMDKVHLKISYENHTNNIQINQDFHIMLFMFNNMIINSLRALEAYSSKKILIHNSLIENKTLRICVSDNGCGIEKEIAEKIFEPYFTTKDNGTGVGLTHVKFVVESILKGQIALLHTEEAEMSTMFEIKIPIEDETQSINN